MTAIEIGIEVAGWAGAILILIAYGLLSAGRLGGRSAVYQWMNVIGATGFLVNGWWHGALPSATLNLIWMGIGLSALWQLRRRPVQQ